MLGKLIVLGSVVLVLVAYTGINAVQYYHEYTTIRDQTQPITDNLIEKVLWVVSHSDLKSRIHQMIGGM